MIFGKTNSVKHELSQQEIKRKIAGVKQFAYLPVHLATGEYVWLQPYWAYYQGDFDRSKGEYFLWSSSPDSKSPYFKAYLNQLDTNPLYQT